LAIVRKGELTFKGEPRTLVGPRLSPGDPAPDFSMLDRAFRVVRLHDTPRKVRVFSVVPSLDTSVCDLQSRRFNQEARELGDAVAAYAISVDTPFGQSRWCGAAEAQHIALLSDVYDGSFGAAYGVRIEEMGLLARSVFVLDAEGVLRHVEYVPEFTSLPDFDAALAAVRRLIG